MSNKESGCDGNGHQNSTHRLEYKTLFVSFPIMLWTKLWRAVNFLLNLTKY